MEQFILKKRSIWFHIIVTYLTCGIWAILYFCFKYKKTSQAKNNACNITNVTDKYIFNTKIAGVTFDNRQSLLKKCSVNQKVLIKWDKDNTYSKTGHALAVFTNIDNKTEQLGYIPENNTNTLFHKYEKQFTNDNSFAIEGYISKITGGTKDKATLGCVIIIKEQ